ncbi:hypothetical protein TNCT_447031 [Trichonephila clavata]|uniref:BTB domain-containing protein n=1 Tax=Trichonephila clavata TaxID=2740835 RepID=A0A8X6L824_TRICU|nr:hypothetical protein TNCT_447031 [Trichonephila clavata]
MILSFEKHWSWSSESLVFSDWTCFHVYVTEMEWGWRRCLGYGEEKKCHFQWNLESFEVCVDERIESPKFSTPLLPGVVWYLEILLVSSEELKELKIFLHRAPGLNLKRVVVNIQFDVSCSGTETTKTIIGTGFDWTSHFHDESNSVTVIFDRKLKDNWLSINCVFNPSNVQLNGRFHFLVDRRLSVDLLYLLKSGLFYDTILCAGSEGFSRDFKVHKAVLHARAPALLNVETSDFTHSIGRIRISYISADVIEEVLNYAYSGRARTYLSRINIYESAAQVFNLPDLKRQLAWRDFPKADTHWEIYPRWLLWTLKGFFSDQNRPRNFSLNKEMYLPFECGPVTISCRIEYVEGRREGLVFESEFTSFSSSVQAIILSCFCQLICNDPKKEQENSIKFEHFLTPNITRRKKVLFLSWHLLSKKHNFAVLDENSLKIAFTIRLSRGTIKSSEICHENTQHLDFSKCPDCDRLSSDLTKLYLAPKYADFMIACENGKEFHAHKAILAARHQPFRKLLEENKCLHTLKTKYKEHTLLKLLAFLYTGRPLDC